LTSSGDRSDDPASHSSGPASALGPWVGIGVPPDIALRLAGARPILSLDPGLIAAAGLDRLNGAVVACMLLGDQMDAVDIILLLVEAGFRGEVMVIAPPMPSPRMVQRELSRLGKGLKIKLAVI